MNKTILIGRLTKDLELRYTSNNKPVVEFNLAVNRPVIKDGEKQADFINCTVYGTQAENLKKYQSKGSLIAVIGELRVDQWQDEEGKNKYKNYVLVSNIEYLGNKSKEETEKSNDNQINNITDINDKQEADPYAEFGHQIQITDEDLPF